MEGIFQSRIIKHSWSLVPIKQKCSENVMSQLVHFYSVRIVGHVTSLTLQ